jgi:hypothetical protein
MKGLPTPVSACPTTAIQYHAAGDERSVSPGNDERQHKSPPATVKVAPT